jgi:hypothetical protein
MSTDSECYAPVYDGEPLATISRGTDRELRIRWREHSGYRFLDLREWSNSPGDAWWPVKGKGITIKPRELETVLEAVQALRRQP